MVDVIDANLGELSPFHQAFGYYVHGLAIEAAVLPAGWQRRAIAVRNANTGNGTGWCVEAHDLAASKLVAFRQKDREFVRTLIAEDLGAAEAVAADQAIAGKRPATGRAARDHGSMGERHRARSWPRVRVIGAASVTRMPLA
jgi:hypothetical protein